MKNRIDWTQSPVAVKALENWLRFPTALNGHTDDNEGFYLFVAAVWNETHGMWDEQSTIERIATVFCQLNGETDKAFVFQRAARLVGGKGTVVLDFLNSTAGAKGIGLTAR